MTTGQIIAASVHPFIFSKHSLKRHEAMEMISKPIDREIEPLKAFIKKVAAIGILGEKSFSVHQFNIIINEAIKLSKP